MNAMQTAPSAPSRRQAIAGRALAFFLLWLVLTQSIKPADVIIGLLTAGSATWLSLRLLPSVSGYVDFRRFALLFPHFIRASVMAGIDVARRALDPRMPLHCDLVDYRPDFPTGLARNTFATFTSLMPGTVPVDDSEQTLTYHCLDTTQPVAVQLRAEEHRLANAVVSGRRHG